MKNFRDYENLIRETIQKISDEDNNWNFTLRSLGKYNVRIRWTYLDYLGENENCFMITLRNEGDDPNEEMFLVSRTPHCKMINGHFVSEEDKKKFWQESYESAIKDAIYEISSYAHNYY